MSFQISRYNQMPSQELQKLLNDTPALSSRTYIGLEQGLLQNAQNITNLKLEVTVLQNTMTAYQNSLERLELQVAVLPELQAQIEALREIQTNLAASLRAILLQIRNRN